MTGVELELLAPARSSRADLAHLLAEAVDGDVQIGFKYVSPGIGPGGRPRCELTPAHRVVDAKRGSLATLVDDITIEVDHRSDDIQTTSAPSTAPPPQLTMDDVRLALWTERRCWSARGSTTEQLLAPMLETFDAAIELVDPRAGPTQAVRDPWGHPLATVAPYPAERLRVCEVVTRPLRRDERTEAVRSILELATTLGFAVPAEAALHIHFDAAPWRATPKLAGLIRRHVAERATLNARWQPNPRCRRLGPLPDQVQRVARECPADLDFSTLAAALLMAGASKDGDLNIKWVATRHPTQPTLEYRALPMSLDPERVCALVDEVEAWLLDVWREAS